MTIIVIIMRNIEIGYKNLLSDILINGELKPNRTGTDAYSVFNRTLEHDMIQGFPLLTSKKVSFKAARTELLWILQGRTDLKYLEDNGVNYWTPDYKRSGRTDGTLGPIYGAQWRNFGGVDQLANVINELKQNPNSRRLLVSAWNPIEMEDMALPPCHYAFQLYVRDSQLDLMWMQRSVDMFLGLPYDIAMYALLLELIAKEAGYVPGKLMCQLGDCHIYENHVEQAQKYIDRPRRVMPTLELESGIKIDEQLNLTIPTADQIKLLNYNPYSAITAPLSVGN